MTLPDITKDCPDALDEIYTQRCEIKPTKEHEEYLESATIDMDEREADDDCPEKWFAIGCCSIAVAAALFAVFVLPYCFR